MRVKLDENLPIQLKRLFTESGHDAATVVDEGLGRAAPSTVPICFCKMVARRRGVRDEPRRRSATEDPQWAI